MMPDINRLNLKTRLKWWKEAISNTPYPLEYPVILQFPATNRCNGRCLMCNVWKQQAAHEISAGDLDRIIQNPLFGHVSVVGINGGEPTLRDDLGDLTRVLCDRLPSLRVVSLITNALASEKAIHGIEAVAGICGLRGVKFDLMVSVDGVGAVHDRVRGREGAFENAVSVIDYARTNHTADALSMGCTVIRDNVFGLHELFNFSVSRGVPVKYRLGVPHRRLGTMDKDPDRKTSPFDLDFPQRVHFAEFLGTLLTHELSPARRAFYRSIQGQLVHIAPRRTGCDWRHRGVTLTAEGKLAYCAVQSRELGDALTHDSEALYFGNKAYLDRLTATHCGQCAHDYCGLPERRDLAIQRLKQVGRRVARVLRILPRRFRPTARSGAWKAHFPINSESPPDVPGHVASSPNEALQRPRVMICGWYGTETTGDKAILGALLHTLGQALGRYCPIIVSLQPHISQLTRIQMPELADVVIKDPDWALTHMTETDLLVFGGGPLMAIAPIVTMEALFTAARKQKVPSVIAGCGVGPLDNAEFKDAVSRILKMAHARIFRDGKSKALAETMGTDTREDSVAEDPAFAWCERCRSDILKPEPEPVLLLGLRDWPFRQYGPHLDERAARAVKEKAEAAIVTALRILCGRMEALRIIPFPMCTHSVGGDDRFYYLRLFRHYPDLQERIDPTLFGREPSPEEALEWFEKASAVLAMRYHSLVFALALGLPAVAIDYTLGKGKVAALANRYVIPCRSFDDLDPDFLADELGRCFNEPRTGIFAEKARFPEELTRVLRSIIRLSR